MNFKNHNCFFQVILMKKSSMKIFYFCISAFEIKGIIGLYIVEQINWLHQDTLENYVALFCRRRSRNVSVFSFLVPLSSRVRLTSWAVTEDSISQPSDVYLLLALYEGTVSDTALPAQKPEANLEYLSYS